MTKKMTLKKSLLFMLAIALFVISTQSVFAQEAPIKLVVNGTEVQTDVPPQLINHRTMVPVRVAAESLGESIIWDAEKQAVLINSDKSQAGPREDVIQLIVNGNRMVPEVAPMLISNRTMVPIRFIGEALGADVRWEGSTRTVYIQTNSASGPQTPGQSSDPVDSGKVVIGAEHVIDWDADTVQQKYANAKRLSILDHLDIVTYGEGVERNGTKFTNTLTVPGGNSNRFVQIGLKDGEGMLDLTELNGSAGLVGVHIQATVDVSNTTNGMYTYLKNDVNDKDNYVTTRHLIDWRNDTEGSGPREHFIELETTLWDIDDAFVEILLPYQAEITIHDVFLFVEKEVPGFGDMHERITGGTGASQENTHVVHTAAEFIDAIEKVKAANDAPSIIYVNGTISYDDTVEVTGRQDREISLGSDTKNLSVIGVADRGLFDGVGIKIHGHNTIIENLTFQYVQQKDTLQVNNATDVWIRHNTFIDGGRDLPEGIRSDELMSIKNNSQHVIVSWNHFKDSNRVLLVGSNDGIDALPDRRLIMHHNFIENVTQRVPLYRGGHAHIYNNYIKNVRLSASNVRSNAKMRFENNVYEDVRDPIGDFHGHIPGRWEVSGNIYINSTGSQPTESTIQINFKDYEYELDPAEDVQQIVMQGAGAGKIEQDLSFLNNR